MWSHKAQRQGEQRDTIAKVKNGNLFIPCANGAVVITPDGEMKIWDGVQ
jgi:peptidase E